MIRIREQRNSNRHAKVTFEALSIKSYRIKCLKRATHATICRVQFAGTLQIGRCVGLSEPESMVRCKSDPADYSVSSPLHSLSEHMRKVRKDGIPPVTISKIGLARSRITVYGPGVEQIF